MFNTEGVHTSWAHASIRILHRFDMYSAPSFCLWPYGPRSIRELRIHTPYHHLLTERCLVALHPPRPHLRV